MLKSVLKCIESIRIKKWVENFQIPESQLGGRGSGRVGQKPTFLILLFLNTSLRERLKKTKDFVCSNFRQFFKMHFLKTLNPSKKPSLVLPSSSSSPPSGFLHRLQTSITRSIIKLECFLRPFLKTRSNDESAHTFKSSLRFLEVPQKGVFKKLFFCIFLPHFLTRFGLIGSVKTFSKVLGVGMNVGPYMAYILYQ